MKENFQELIGTTAGKIWCYISENGPVDIIHLKISLRTSNSLLFAALGWLAREEKITIVEQNNKLYVNLR